MSNRPAIDVYVWADRAIVPRPSSQLCDEFLQLQDQVVSDACVMFMAGLVRKKVTPISAEIGGWRMEAKAFVDPTINKFSILITRFGKFRPAVGRQAAPSRAASWDDVIFMFRFTIEPDDGGARLLEDSEMSEEARALIAERRRRGRIGTRMQLTVMRAARGHVPDGWRLLQLDFGDGARKTIRRNKISKPIVLSIFIVLSGRLRGGEMSILYSARENGYLTAKVWRGLAAHGENVIDGRRKPLGSVEDGGFLETNGADGLGRAYLGYGSFGSPKNWENTNRVTPIVLGLENTKEVGSMCDLMRAMGTSVQEPPGNTEVDIGENVDGMHCSADKSPRVCIRSQIVKNAITDREVEEVSSGNNLWPAWIKSLARKSDRFEQLRH